MKAKLWLIILDSLIVPNFSNTFSSSFSFVEEGKPLMKICGLVPDICTLINIIFIYLKYNWITIFSQNLHFVSYELNSDALFQLIQNITSLSEMDKTNKEKKQSE